METSALPPFSPHPSSAVPTLRGSAGFALPVLAFGTGTTWYGASAGEQAGSLKAALLTALRLGYHHIDCAEMYANAAPTGEAIAEFLAEQSEVRREHLFVVGKVANVSKRPADVRASCERAIAELGCGYLDLLLVHSPFDAPVPLSETWAALEGCAEAGLCRHVGVSNFRIADLEELLLHCRIRPALNQVECNPALAQPGLAAWCEGEGVVLSSYGALLPITHQPVECRELLAALAEIEAAEPGTSQAELLLQWQLAQGRVIVTTSSKRERLQRYLGTVALTQRSRASAEAIERITRAGASGGTFRAFWRKQLPDGFSE